MYCVVLFLVFGSIFQLPFFSAESVQKQRNALARVDPPLERICWKLEKKKITNPEMEDYFHLSALISFLFFARL